MNKLQNANNPTSCWNKAADDEPVFVLRANDPIAPTIVRLWASLADSTGGHELGKCYGAFAVSQEMEAWREAHALPGLTVDHSTLRKTIVATVTATNA